MRGQVTIFVIIGLAVLLIAGIFLISHNSSQVSLSSSQDAARVTQLTQNCLSTVGEDVLREIGSNGGYLDTSRFKNTQSMRDTQVVSVPPQNIVLWHEVHPCESNAAGCVANNRPPLCEKNARCPVDYPRGTTIPTSIQEELERGVEQRIDSCLDFSPFPDLVVKKQGAPIVHATIREENIALDLEYPMTITSTDGQAVQLEKYATTLDVALPQLYRFAAKIQNAEISTSFLENAFLHLLSIYSGIDQELPPFREVSLIGSTHYWVRSEVQDRLEQDVLPFMNFVQIINAQESFSPVLAPEVDEEYRPYAEGAYEYLLVKLDNETYPYSVQTEYPYTPIFLDINGKELLRPQQIGGGGYLVKFAGMLFTQYKFRYTVAFPVIMHVADPAAFHGRGYQIDFGLEANIRNNHPLNVSSSVTTVSSGDAVLDLSDPRQLVNHTYTINVFDQYTHQPLSGVAINYECDLRYYMGETDDSGVWRGKLPYCLAGGALVVQRNHYLGTGQDLINVEEDGAASELQIGMWPYRQKTISVYKITADDMVKLDAGSTRADARTSLSENDSLVLSFARQPSTPYDDESPLNGILQFGSQGVGAVNGIAIDELLKNLADAKAAGAFNDDMSKYDESVQALKDLKNGNTTGSAAGYAKKQQVSIVPGTYDIQGTLIYTGLIQIPEEKRSAGGIFGKDYTLPAQNYSSWISGGVVLTGTNGLVLTPDDIYSDANITIYVLEQPIPVVWKDVERQIPLEEYESTYGRAEYIKPEIS